MRLGENFRHMLTRAMGAEPSVLPDVIEIPCFRDDILTISSDGLTDLVSPEEIMAIVVNDRPERSCQKLVDLANERGGVDNITVIVVKIKGIRGKGGGFRSFLYRKLRSLFSAPLKK
jgi:PPM family protein phosphatase